MLSGRCLSVLSVCDVGVLWPNGWMDQDATWYGGRPRPRRHCARWGPSFPRKGHSIHIFRPMSIVAKRLDASGYHLVRRWASVPATLLDEDPAASRGTAATHVLSIVAKWHMDQGADHIRL